MVGQHLRNGVEVKQISTSARLARKKYLGVWSRTSVAMARRMSRFPSPVSRYMFRNSINSSCYCLGSPERPRRKKSTTQVKFALSELTREAIEELSVVLAKASPSVALGSHPLSIVQTFINPAHSLLQRDSPTHVLHHFYQ